MKDGRKGVIGLFKQAAADWSEDKASRLAAALAYYTIFSLAPLLIIAIAVAGMVFGEQAARGEIVDQIQGLVGKQGAEAIQMMIANAGSSGSGGILATILGVVVLLWGASNVFAALQDALNTIWEVAPKPDQGFWATVRSRFLSFGMVLGIGFLLLVSLVASAALTAAAKAAGGFIADNEFLMQTLNLVVSFGVITLLFAALYKVLPDVRIRWKDVWVGALVTSALFVIGKFLIGLYLGHSSTASSFGAAGSLVVLLIWVYYSAQIFFFGAEFTQVYADTYGADVRPSDNAIALTPKMRARQGAPTRKWVQAAAERQDGRRQASHQHEAHERAATQPASSEREHQPPAQETSPTLAAAAHKPPLLRDVKETAADLSSTLSRVTRRAKKYYEDAREHVQSERRRSSGGR